MNEVEVLLHQFGQSGNSLVEVFLPDVVESKNAFCHFLCVAGSPKFGELVHNLLVVVGNDRCSVGTFATFVIGDDGSQTEYEALWEFAFALQIDLYARQVAGFILGEAIKHD
mgnify:CR=1 FL=1